MPRGTPTEDPVVLKRRQQNKIASSRCRERKLSRALFLEKELLDMRFLIEEKQQEVHEMFAEIQECHQLVKNNEMCLTSSEIEHFNTLLEEFMRFVNEKKSQEINDKTPTAPHNKLQNQAHCVEN